MQHCSGPRFQISSARTPASPVTSWIPMAAVTPRKRPYSEAAGTPAKVPRTVFSLAFPWWPRMKPAGAADIPFVAHRDAHVWQPGLKIKPTWVKEMMLHMKDMELRTYLPSKFTPRGHAQIQFGERIFILSAGYLCGSCRLARVIEFNDWNKLEVFEGCHRVTRISKFEDKLTKAFDNDRPVYGWCLEDFRWCPVPLRSGKDGVPGFSGQAFGHVWSTVKLPAALEDRSGLND